MNNDRKIVTSHQTSTKTDVNNAITVTAESITSGGAKHRYQVLLPGQDEPIVLNFQTLGQLGLTNEVLLAIAADRLADFQKGPYPCHENDMALSDLKSAMTWLKQRTNRRVEAGLEGKLQEDEQAPKAIKQGSEMKSRVSYDDTTLQVGEEKFEAVDLVGWKAWQQVEAACKKIKSPTLTIWEIQLIEKFAASLKTSGAANGFAELKSALANTAAV